MKTLIMVTLCLASNYLGAMTAGQKLMRMVIGDCVRASRPQDYDYELLVRQDAQRNDQAMAMFVAEKCHDGYVVGRFVTSHISYGYLEKRYGGAAGSAELHQSMMAAGTCATADKVCSPAGMCICTAPGARILHELLRRK